MKPALNPGLEAIRNKVLSEKGNYSEVCRDLVVATGGVHASYLFHPEGRPALKAFCTVMSSTPEGIQYVSWKDLADSLGLTFHQRGCIENYKHEDSTEITLKTFAQKYESTLDMLVQVVYDMKRYDILIAIKNPLLSLVEVAKREHAKRLEQVDGGYSSLSDGSSLQSNSITGSTIMVPEGHHHLRYQLPITLQELMHERVIPNSEGVNSGVEVILSPPNIIEERNNSSQREEAETQRSSIILPPRRRVRCSKRVMVTFARDGEAIARHLAKEFRKPRGSHLPIGVLILDELNERIVNTNPEKFIMHVFQKMDFIIPIVTPGYLNSLRDRPSESNLDRSFTHVDALYVQLIHDLMSKYYVANCCRNDKVRSVIPDANFKEVFMHPHMKIDPVLAIFFKASEIEVLAQRILRSSKRSNGPIP